MVFIHQLVEDLKQVSSIAWIDYAGDKVHLSVAELHGLHVGDAVLAKMYKNHWIECRVDKLPNPLPTNGSRNTISKTSKEIHVTSLAMSSDGLGPMYSDKKVTYECVTTAAKLAEYLFRNHPHLMRKTWRIVQRLDREEATAAPLVTTGHLPSSSSSSTTTGTMSSTTSTTTAGLPSSTSRSSTTTTTINDGGLSSSCSSSAGAAAGPRASSSSAEDSFLVSTTSRGNNDHSSHPPMRRPIQVTTGLANQPAVTVATSSVTATTAAVAAANAPPPRLLAGGVVHAVEAGEEEHHNDDEERGDPHHDESHPPIYVYSLHGGHHSVFDMRKVPYGEDAIVNQAYVAGPKKDLPLGRDVLRIRSDLISRLLEKGLYTAFNVQCNADVNQKWAIAARDEDDQIICQSIMSHVRVFVLLQLHIFAINAGTVGLPAGYKALHVQVGEILA